MSCPRWREWLEACHNFGNLFFWTAFCLLLFKQENSPTIRARAKLAEMAGSYLANDETRAERVKILFDTIAPRYDLINDLQSLWLHRRWKKHLVALADPRPGQRALDLHAHPVHIVARIDHAIALRH